MDPSGHPIRVQADESSGPSDLDGLGQNFDRFGKIPEDRFRTPFRHPKSRHHEGVEYVPGLLVVLDGHPCVAVFPFHHLGVGNLTMCVRGHASDAVDLVETFPGPQNEIFRLYGGVEDHEETQGWHKLPDPQDKLVCHGEVPKVVW